MLANPTSIPPRVTLADQIVRVSAGPSSSSSSVPMAVTGLAITAAYFTIRALIRRNRAPEPVASPARGYLWILANALCGAVIGVSCYQWALATTPSGIVLPIVATTPLVIIPFSCLIEGERPTSRSLAGGAVAVAGAVELALAR